jgi:aspartate/methionine/tyrosine aminotransferase
VQGLSLTAELVLAAVEPGTRLVLVNTPHNPTGAVMARVEIEALAQTLAKRGIPLLVDEVYHPLYFDTPQRSAAMISNTIIVSDMSKALSLSGLRIGWILEPDAARREQFINARSYFAISGSPVTEAAAAHALLHRDAILARLENVTR